MREWLYNVKVECHETGNSYQHQNATSPLSKPILQVAKYIKFSLHFLIIEKDANKFMNAGFDKSLETLW